MAEKDQDKFLSSWRTHYEQQSTKIDSLMHKDEEINFVPRKGNITTDKKVKKNMDVHA